MTALLAGGCAAAALLVGWRGSPEGRAARRLRSVVAAAPGLSGPRRGRPTPDGQGREPALRWAASAVLAIGLLLVVGGAAGIVLAVLSSVGLPRWLAAQESGRQRRERRHREAELPLALDVVAACVAAGATTLEAVTQVAAASRSTLSHDLRLAAASLRSGATPEEAWRALPEDLAGLGTVLDRSMRSGASGATLLRSLADRLRADQRASRLDAARRLGVHAAAPLGLCFLPGFVVLGLVPVVVGLVGQVL